MLLHLQERLGFSYRLIYSYDGNWGSQLANGTWNGMVGMVARKEADMGVAPFTVTLQREEAIDFTFPYFTDPAAILTPAPVRVDRITAFLDPFGYEVWLAIAVSLIFLGPTMYLFTRLQKYQFIYPHSYPVGQGKSTSVLGYYWMLITALLQQGVVYPMSTATRVVFGGWIVGVVALSCAYTGVLISFLTVPRVAKGVDSLQELALQSELQWTFRRASALENLFLNQDAKGVYRAIGAPFAESTEDLVTTDYNGVLQVLKGTHAFIKEKSYLDFATAEDAAVSGECRLALARSHFFPANFGWVLPEGDPLKVLFDKEIIRMQETGLFDKWKQKFWPKNDRCRNRSPVSSTEPLSLFDFLGAFMLLGTGSCLALGNRCRRVLQEIREKVKLQMTITFIRYNKLCPGSKRGQAAFGLIKRRIKDEVFSQLFPLFASMTSTRTRSQTTVSVCLQTTQKHKQTITNAEIQTVCLQEIAKTDSL
ncbi:glutamate receptor ionotropic, delta-2-like [Penaeus monodon]|uniref:glutamate receptor ionotropic, delta-2-like n=1 Tax=Penaeus monodon TaxID=6687 RepID=UPI0018A75D8D|nr:glutamate receptor ionotropic, delta-2-like [Penaeus monodon]